MTDASQFPLVTIALVAYNQEAYIRKAVEGALAQTYQPLEIILSDDCSTDGTFEVIQEMALSYKGPHRVRAMRHRENLGTVNHLIAVAKVALGEILVVSAGDDISYPGRTAALVRAFNSDNIMCVTSGYDEIDSSGEIVWRDQQFPLSADAQSLFSDSKIAKRRDGRIESVIGFAASYRTSFWASMPISEDKLLVEDGLATVIMNCMGCEIKSLHESLLAYRVHGDSLSLRQSKNTSIDIQEREQKISATGREIVSAIDYALRYLAAVGQPIESTVLRKLKKRQDYGRTVMAFWGQPIGIRLQRLVGARDADSWSFLLPRMFGLSAFLFIKKMLLFFAALRTSTTGAS